MELTQIADLIAEAELVGGPGVIRMPIKYYMELRKQGRTTIDVATNTKLLKDGILGSVFGLSIQIHKRGFRDFVIVEDNKGQALVHLCELGGIHRGAPDICSNPQCIIRYVMAE